MKSYGTEKRVERFFYLDDTWVTAGHAVSKVWVGTAETSSHDTFMLGLMTGLK